MSDYTQIVDYSVKDALSSGDAAKRILGSEIDAELAAIATAIASKLDSSGGTDLAVADGGTGASTAAGARTNLGLGTLATQNAGAVAITGGTVAGITDIAVADGGTGASTAAGARTNLGLGTLATLSSVTATEIDAGAVGNSELAATSVTWGNISASLQQSTGTVLPGGGTVAISFTGGGQTLGWSLGVGELNSIKSHVDGTYAWKVIAENTGGTNRDYHFQAYYINSSPPWDLGDGEFDAPFVFLEVRPDGTVVRVDASMSPPWAYNGPTSIIPDFEDRNGRKHKLVKELIAEHGSRAAARRAGLTWEQIAERLATDALVPVEITHAIKNADMPLIPHPFGTVVSGNSVVLLDPLAPAMERLRTLHGEFVPGEKTLAQLLYEDEVRFTPIAGRRASPPGVQLVRPRWRISQ